jgi:hypothetical protein
MSKEPKMGENGEGRRIGGTTSQAGKKNYFFTMHLED